MTIMLALESACLRTENDFSTLWDCFADVVKICSGVKVLSVSHVPALETRYEHWAQQASSTSVCDDSPTGSEAVRVTDHEEWRQ